MHMAIIYRKQRECHQYWTTHLHSWKTLTLFGPAGMADSENMHVGDVESLNINMYE
jgi:hypothetical protein